MIPFEILNRWTSEVQVTAQIDCAPDAPVSLKLGLAVRWAVKEKADLSGADLRHAVLAQADLRRARLLGAQTRQADLAFARLDDAIGAETLQESAS